VNTRTGEIVDLEEVLKKPEKEQKHYIQISEANIEAVRAMTRNQRRAWAKEFVRQIMREDGAD
jgi:non-homologous end joining protein Ku